MKFWIQFNPCAGLDQGAKISLNSHQITLKKKITNVLKFLIYFEFDSYAGLDQGAKISLNSYQITVTKNSENFENFDPL